jgi:hypothetical protein
MSENLEPEPMMTDAKASPTMREPGGIVMVSVTM